MTRHSQGRAPRPTRRELSSKARRYARFTTIAISSRGGIVVSCSRAARGAPAPPRVLGILVESAQASPIFSRLPERLALALTAPRLSRLLRAFAFLSRPAGRRPRSMASPAPVAARAARAFAAPRPVANGESARTRLGRRRRPVAASSPRPGPARARDAFSFSSPGSSRRALRRLGRRDKESGERFVVAAAAEGDGSSAFWDAGDDGPPPAHRGYAPVPGFGEYYVPPKPPKTEKSSSARDGAR